MAKRRKVAIELKKEAIALSYARPFRSINSIQRYCLWRHVSPAMRLFESISIDRMKRITAMRRKVEYVPANLFDRPATTTSHVPEFMSTWLWPIRRRPGTD
jgi:hypothetical protein